MATSRPRPAVGAGPRAPHLAALAVVLGACTAEYDRLVVVAEASATAGSGGHAGAGGEGGAGTPSASGTSSTAVSGSGGSPPLVPPSCKAILDAAPMSPSGPYEIDPTGADAHSTYCDMTTDGGGWTMVGYPADTPAAVAVLVGTSGRQMMKCSEAGAEHVISPPFASWSWTPGQFVQLPGTWIANGAAVMCAANPEYTMVMCSSWFGVGCGDGPGSTNKVFPGVSDEDGGSCADRKTAHTNGALTVCDGESGPDNYSGWVVFLREDG